MKLEGRQVGAFLAAPGAVRGALLYGEDEGLIRERAETLVGAILGAREDPFRLCVVSREAAAADPSLLASEMAALSLTGGRRCVRLRGATNALAAAVEAALEVPGDTFLVVEAGSLKAGEKLRSLFERRNDLVAIPCWPERGADLAAAIGETLRGLGVSADADALGWLAQHLGEDGGITRRELEKLALYVGEGGRADVAACEAVVGDHAGLGVEDALFAAAAGDVARADRALAAAFAAGASSIAVVRAALRHLQRLALACAEGLASLPAKEAARRARPPVFFRHEQDFARALSRWSGDRAAQAADRLFAAERACKSTGMPDALIARRAVLEIALTAARR
ncbi:MAG: DNA polymerase III subunit delta [Elioraea sp.]|nr:DNA polymerase III subunit delta [Elioraea sp.]